MKHVLLPLMRIGIFAFACLHFSSKVANAQVTADDTVNTQVNQTDNVSEITGGETRGDNLFHSFQEFSVGTGETASFLNSNDIANIFSRVTGGSASSIDGLIQASGSANLFLINPAGIIFGEGASLNIGGSFYGSSASSILFEDGEFSATDLENPPLLTINAPIGLGFRDNPQDIVNQSRALDSTGQFISGLQVLAGKNLALIGGDVRFDGGVITTPGGRVELGGLNAAGTISFNDNGSFSFPDGIVRGDIFLNQEALINVGVTDINGGELSITTSNLTLNDGSQITANTFGDGDAGKITVDAVNQVSLDTGNIFSNVSSSGNGNAGEITIEGNSISLTNGAQIQSGVFEGGQGNGNNVTLNARGGDVTISSSNQATSGIFADVETVGDFVSGNIQIDTQGSILLNNAVINNTNAGTGFAGDINLNAPNEISIKDSRVVANGNEGRIFIGDTVRPSRITLEGQRTEIETEDGPSSEFSNLLSTDNSNPNDLAGRIRINARDRINVIGTNIDSQTETTRLDRDPENQDEQNNNFSRIFLSIDGENRQGSINIERSQVDTTNFSTGLAGLVTLDAANEISIKDSEIFVEGNDGVIEIGDTVQPSQVTLEGQRTETETEDGPSSEFSNLLSTDNSNPNDLAGRISINARDRINVIGTSIDSETETTRLDRDPENQDEQNNNFSRISLTIDGENPQGSINIERSQVDTTNFSTGLAGFVNLDAANEISIKDSEIFVEGNDGAIAIGDTVQPSQVTLEGQRTGVETEDGANFEFSNLLSTENSKPNDLASRIRISARDRINIIGTDIQSSTETTRTTDINDEDGFNFSRITLNVDEENILGSIAVERSRINTANSSTGFAGNVVLNAREKIEISDSSIFSTGQLGQISIGASETSSPKEIKFNNAFLTVSNEKVTVPENEDPQLDAGKISINATNNISVANNSDIRTFTERFGNAGSLTIQSKNGTVSFDNSQVFSDVEPGGFGSAGDINITANSITLIRGSQLQSGTIATSDDSVISGLGDGGDITLNARESITFSGRDPDDNLSSAIFTNIQSGTTGNAGNISVTTGSLSLNDEAQLNTESSGFTFNEQTSDAGKVVINADIIELDGNSVISAQAFNGNNGGNLEIDANFVVAYPNDGMGNDLFATSDGGNGGDINLTVEKLFGLETGRSIDENGIPLINNSNDIDASSNVLGLDGTVNINTSRIDPLQGVMELPSNVVEAKQTSEQTCSVDRDTKTANGLIVTGRGGVQPSPDLPLSSQTIVDNGKNIATETNEAEVRAIAPVHTSQGDIIPAQGIVVTKDGRIMLTAYSTESNSRVPQGSVNCTR